MRIFTEAKEGYARTDDVFDAVRNGGAIVDQRRNPDEAVQGFLVARDNFMSGWDGVPVRRSFVAYALTEHVNRYALETWMNERGDLAIAYPMAALPALRRGDHVSVYDAPDRFVVAAVVGLDQLRATYNEAGARLHKALDRVLAADAGNPEDQEYAAAAVAYQAAQAAYYDAQKGN